MSPALAGGFLNTGPPGMSLYLPYWEFPNHTGLCTILLTIVSCSFPCCLFPCVLRVGTFMCMCLLVNSNSLQIRLKQFWRAWLKASLLQSKTAVLLITTWGYEQFGTSVIKFLWKYFISYRHCELVTKSHKDELIFMKSQGNVCVFWFSHHSVLFEPEHWVYFLFPLSLKLWPFGNPRSGDITSRSHFGRVVHSSTCPSCSLHNGSSESTFIWRSLTGRLIFNFMFPPGVWSVVHLQLLQRRKWYIAHLHVCVHVRLHLENGYISFLQSSS